MNYKQLFQILNLIVITICSTSLHAQIVKISAERVRPDDQNSSILLTWELRNPATVFIYASTDPDATIDQSTLVAEGITSNNYQTSAFPGRRVFFIVDPVNENPVKVASRLLPLEGGRNFRDIGGYQNREGKRVRWGQVYRSGVMNRISDQDYRFLDQLDIGTIIDFRSTEERESEPTNWQAGNPDIFAVDYTDEGASELMSSLFKPDITPGKMKDQMAALYYDIVHQQEAAYTMMFDDLAGKNQPLLYNCSAGKDRTGVATALILSLLDVPREDIVHDYSLSDDYVDFVSEFTSETAQVNEAYSFLSQIPVELLEPLMASHPEYIESALDYLDSEYGSVMNYIRSELEVTDQEVAAIRTRLLETID